MAYTQTVNSAQVPILGFSQTYDHLGRVTTATGPAGSRSYSYDDRARLTKVKDTGTEGCTTRSYSFSGDSNRTNLTSYAPDLDGSCQTGTASSTTSYSYDQADRITTAGYAYDRMGRTTTVPKADTNQAGQSTAGDLAITYAANDMVASLQQTTVEPVSGLSYVSKQTFALDGSDRISVVKNYSNSVQIAETLNHYDGSSDNPAWTQTKTRPDSSTAWTTTWDRYVGDLTGALAIDLDDTGSTDLQLANLHGDIVGTATIGQAGVNSYSEADEFGNTVETSVQATRYGWLGTHQRDLGAIGGLALMGARLYDSASARFLSRDSVVGGNANAYTYPADPINMFDLNGKWCFFGLGTSCTDYVKDWNGTSIPVRANVRRKILNKHGIQWSTARYLMPRLKLRAVEYRAGMSRPDLVYTRRLYRVTCTWWGFCKKTGESIVMKAIVNFGTGGDGHTIGLKTMYCEGVRMCPQWVNSPIKLG
jgi:RHS repeat-associated protein